MNSEEVMTVGDLPEEPLKMPPPYWRSCGAIFHIEKAISDIKINLKALISLKKITDDKLDNYFTKYPEAENESEDAIKEYSIITDDLFLLEHQIKMSCDLAILMSAIQTEDRINMFCVYNLNKNTSESIEKLSTTEKLLILSSALGEHSVKSSVVYSGVKKLRDWRNSFVHGHCVDRPTKSLRHNHLISPDEHPGVPSSITEMLKLVGAFIATCEYLQKISLNPYTSGSSWEVEEFKKELLEISKYKFVGKNSIYSVAI